MDLQPESLKDEEMVKTYSQLVYRQIDPVQQSGTDQRTIIALHGNQGGLDDLVPLAKSLGSENRVVAPEAARGVYSGLQLVSRTWFGGTCGKPEPASFGDSLAQLERFIYDVRNRTTSGMNQSPPWLLGYDQGAVLALTLAIVTPEAIAGVMAIGGQLPTFSRSNLLEPVRANLPALLLGDHARREVDGHGLASTVSRLTDLGNHVTVRWVERPADLGPPVSEELRTWLNAQSNH